MAADLAAKRKSSSATSSPTYGRPRPKPGAHFWPQRYWSSVSQENVEAVRTMFASYARGDVEAVISAAAVDIEVRPGVVGSLEGTVYRGKEGFRRFLADVDAAWEEWRIEIEELRDLNDTVLALGRVRARARDGMSLEAPSGWICGMRDEKVAEFRSFASRADALEAAGLPE